MTSLTSFSSQSSSPFCHALLPPGPPGGPLSVPSTGQRTSSPSLRRRGTGSRWGPLALGRRGGEAEGQGTCGSEWCRARRSRRGTGGWAGGTANRRDIGSEICVWRGMEASYPKRGGITTVRGHLWLPTAPGKTAVPVVNAGRCKLPGRHVGSRPKARCAQRRCTAPRRPLAVAAGGCSNQGRTRCLRRAVKPWANPANYRDQSH